jgi:hypothetical protein
MKKTLKSVGLGLCLPVLLLADFSLEAPLGLSAGREAAAVVGAPLTPVSYAGVARRTTRRTVAATSTAAATSAAAATTATATAPPPAPPAPGSPPHGQVVSALPAGCVSAPQGGVEYYRCGSVYYRPAFQGNNLVYVVQ